ncbi:hypothetical protein CSAL01_08511 [Colletotrichum salicis]|uniref:Uncharacterized protein n=1 Tax=Colletotrichum salicis TaxID=1209931 RepID=A0A135TLD9_9PEZI|nr:hypothetical protein CSAL01_08511 [Colletotrichum salicis]
MKFAAGNILALLVALASAQQDPQHYRHLNGKSDTCKRGSEHPNRILPPRRSTVACTLETLGLFARRTKASAAIGITCSKTVDTTLSIVTVFAPGEVDWLKA